MLKNIPSVISPELIKILMEMGHGDELVLADANFPAASHAKRLVRCDGIRICVLLDAILQLFPLDYRINPVAMMAIPADSGYEGNIQERYLSICEKHCSKDFQTDYEERQSFYDRAGRAYAVVATGETERFANILIRKGVVPEI